jgi:hypothetical protein
MMRTSSQEMLNCAMAFPNLEPPLIVLPNIFGVLIASNFKNSEDKQNEFLVNFSKKYRDESSLSSLSPDVHSLKPWHKIYSTLEFRIKVIECDKQAE